MNDWLSKIRPASAIRLATASGYFYVAFLSWVPGNYRAHTIDLSGSVRIITFLDQLEHALAYLLLGALTVIAARQTFPLHRIIFAVVAYAGILELGQFLIAGRDCCVEDFAASAAGGIIGASMTYLASRRLEDRLSLRSLPVSAMRRNK